MSATATGPFGDNDVLRKFLARRLPFLPALSRLGLPVAESLARAALTAEAERVQARVS